MHMEKDFCVFLPLTKARNLFLLFFIFDIHPPFTRKQMVLLYFGLNVRTRLEVVIFEVSGSFVFQMKAEASH